MSCAFLILCHRPPRHLPILAQRFPLAKFYVHYDAKCALDELDFLRQWNNIFLVEQRVTIYWAGFSMILASLNLFQAALTDERNHFFHLMSGDCALLISPDKLAQQCTQQPENTLWIDCTTSKRLRYRVRFNAPHADSVWQRSLTGKLLTKGLQLADWLLPSKQICWTGSQWFSASRLAAEILLSEAQGRLSDFFTHKLCPDEHFFQFAAINQIANLNMQPENHRFIRFNARANHPDLLNLTDLRAAQAAGFWFARKVNPETMHAFLTSE